MIYVLTLTESDPRSISATSVSVRLVGIGVSAKRRQSQRVASALAEACPSHSLWRMSVS